MQRKKVMSIEDDDQSSTNSSGTSSNDDSDSHESKSESESEEKPRKKAKPASKKSHPAKKARKRWSRDQLVKLDEIVDRNPGKEVGFLAPLIATACKCTIDQATGRL